MKLGSEFSVHFFYFPWRPAWAYNFAIRCLVAGGAMGYQQIPYFSAVVMAISPPFSVIQVIL